MDSDSASNILAGIFDATNNLSDHKVTADTYMAVAACLRVGGRKPAGGTQQSQSGQVSSIPQQPTSEFTVPQVVPSTSQSQTSVNVGDQNQSSPEERPAGEGVVSETVEPEWLTPKIFKGTSIG